MTDMCSTEDCNEEACGSLRGKRLCDVCLDGWTEYYADQEGPDPHGDRDPSPEEQAGWAFEDKLAMYRNEH